MKDEESRQYTGDGSVDFKGRPVLKLNTGNWKACPFILGNFFLFFYFRLSKKDLEIKELDRNTADPF